MGKIPGVQYGGKAAPNVLANASAAMGKVAEFARSSVISDAQAVERATKKIGEWDFAKGDNYVRDPASLSTNDSKKVDLDPQLITRTFKAQRTWAKLRRDSKKRTRA